MSGCDASIVPPRPQTKRDPQFMRVSKLLLAREGDSFRPTGPSRLLRIGHGEIPTCRERQGGNRFGQSTRAGSGIDNSDQRKDPARVAVYEQVVAALVKLSPGRGRHSAEGR